MCGGSSRDASAECPVANSTAHGTAEALDENDAVIVESQEHTESDNMEVEPATESNNDVATEAQTVNDPTFMIRMLTHHPFTNEQMEAEADSIYTGLVMLEDKCIEIYNYHTPSPSDLGDITRYLLTIPEARLMLLQSGGMKPEDTVRAWFNKVQKDAIDEYQEPSTLESNNLPVSSPEDYLHGFQVALELRSKELEWPEHEQLVALATAEIGEEGRKKVIDGRYLLDMGYKLVDQFLQDLEIAQAEVQQKAAENSSEAQSRPSHDTRQAALNETSSEEAKAAFEGNFEEMAPNYADATVKVSIDKKGTFKGHADADVIANKVVTQQPSDQDASLATQELQTSEEAKRPPLVENRPLHDQHLYRKVGKEYWVLVEGQWTISHDSTQWDALVKLYHTLLEEHHDFVFAWRHPSASASLQELAAERAVPERMWKHAIHSFLEIMRKRLFESREFMNRFIILAYHMVSCLDETLPLLSWIEYKADLARYVWAIEDVDTQAKQRWRDVSKEEYTRVLIKQSTAGRIYHHLAFLERPDTRASPDQVFDATVSQLFYHTKSLVVKDPFFPARESVLIVIKPIVDRNNEKPVGVPQTDKDHFLTAVVHLILASLEPETLRRHGYRDNRKDHLQAVYAAMEKIKAGRPAKTCTIRPSAKLGLLLCQLLLGIPLANGRWSPMMTAWAPDFMTTLDGANPDAMANARDIHDATIELLHTMIPYVLEEADTRDLGVWGFIYILLVFMRSLKTRPALLAWFGSAFHAEVLAPFLNMLLREDETRGGPALESASQWELVTVCSLLNEEKRLGKYGLSTEDNLGKHHDEQRARQKTERAKSTATVEEVTTEEATPIDTPDWKRVYANPLPEHFLLWGLFFAREAEPCNEPPEDLTSDAAGVSSPTAPEVARVAVQTAEIPAVEQTQGVPLTDCETDEGQERASTDSETGAEGASQVEVQSEETQEADEQELREAEEAELRRQEGLQSDPPLFPNGWLHKSKYNFDEMQVLNHVQNAETYYDRSNQILRLAAQLDGHFFVFDIDEEGRHWISVPGAPSTPKPDSNKKMPEIIEREGGVRVVYVHPSSHAAEIKREEKRTRREKVKEQKWQREREKRPTQSEKPIDRAGAEPKAPNIAATAPRTVSAEDDGPTSAYDMWMTTAEIPVTTKAAEKASSPHDTEPIVAKAETTLSIQGVDDLQDMKGNGAGPDAAEVTISAEDNQADPAMDPQAPVELAKGGLDKMPGMEDEDGWTHISDESHGSAGTAPTVQTDQADWGSMFFGSLPWRSRYTP